MHQNVFHHLLQATLDHQLKGHQVNSISFPLEDLSLIVLLFSLITGGENWPMCPPTLTSGTCGGKTYFWDTAKEDQPQEFKTCFFGDGEVGAICNGKEYSWDPAKQPKPTELEECEKNFAAKAAQ
jgi:hypothetical protein